MDVVVIGAGLSGLTAAATLVAAGASVRVLEAGRSVGGRIQPLRDPAGGQVLGDLGPTWVWPKYQPVVQQWIDRLGVETFAQFNEGDAVVVGYGPAPLRQPLPGQDGMVRLGGGPTTLVDALAGQVGADRLRTSAPVAAIVEDGPDRVAVHLGSGQTVTARAVIVAIPLRVAAATLQMPWASEHLLEVMQRTPTWMSTHAKAVALYEVPFWRAAGLSGRIASRHGPLVEAHDHSGPDGAPAALFGFVGWPPEVRQKDREGLKDAILRQLVECFGPEASQPAQLVVQDWATNPYVVSDLDLSSPANHPDVGPAVLRAPHLEGRVRFAVSEVSDISPGLIEGALAAGQRAAADSLARGL